MYASLSYLPKTPQKAFRSKMKRMQISKAIGEDYTLSDRVNHFEEQS
jgi:hypothetical protein